MGIASSDTPHASSFAREVPSRCASDPGMPATFWKWGTREAVLMPPSTAPDSRGPPRDCLVRGCKPIDHDVRLEAADGVPPRLSEMSPEVFVRKQE